MNASRVFRAVMSALAGVGIASVVGWGLWLHDELAGDHVRLVTATFDSADHKNVSLTLRNVGWRDHSLYVTQIYAPNPPPCWNLSRTWALLLPFQSATFACRFDDAPDDVVTVEFFENSEPHWTSACVRISCRETWGSASAVLFRDATPTPASRGGS